MMNKIATRIFALVVVVLLASCATTKVTYKKLSADADASSPPDGGFVFALLHSSVSFQPATKTKGKVKVDACALKHGGPALKGSAAYAECLQHVKISVTSKPDYKLAYLVTPNSDWLFRETLTPKVSSKNPLVVKSVAVSSTNNAPAIIGAAGTAIVGALLSGPAAAVGAGFFAIVTTENGAAYVPGRPRPKPVSIKEPICATKGFETFDEYQSALNKKGETLSPTPTLPLPLKESIPYTPPKKDKPKGTKTEKDYDCWHALPFHEAGNKVAVWFYRFEYAHRSVASPPDPSIPPVFYGSSPGSEMKYISLKNEWLDPGNKNSSGVAHHKFPVSACTRVKFQITWWQAIQEAFGGHAAKKAGLREKLIRVADPRFIQEITIPKNGTITILPRCGGYEN